MHFPLGDKDRDENQLSPVGSHISSINRLLLT